MALFDHVLLPVASEEDAEATCGALGPHLDVVGRITALHVIEKGGGAIDKAPMEKRRDDAERFLAVVEESLGDAVSVDTRIAFGTNVFEAIFEEAAAVDATAVVFRPRGGSRIVRFLSGDTANNLVTHPQLPVVSLPNPAEETE